MNFSDQRRKRKRIFRQSGSSFFFSVRSLILCFGFVIFLYLLSYTNPFSSSVFRPVLVVSSLSLLSSSTPSSSKSVFGSFFLPLNIENRVLFPDHVLLLVGGGEKDGIAADELECVYHGEKTALSGLTGGSGNSSMKKVVSLDEYDEFRSIVRCPLPPNNYSAEVHLRKVVKNRILVEDEYGFSFNNQTAADYCSWENLTYAATLDEGTVVVFVKGLNLRAARVSDPSQFTCHFGLGKWERNKGYLFTTKALTAAQEVVRCPLPLTLKTNPQNVHGLRVTVGVSHIVHTRPHNRVLPSVAKIVKPGLSKDMKVKHELCVCTMVWNQASAIREWIMYHSWLGVEKWFIYDNNSDDNIVDVIGQLSLEDHNIMRRVWPWIKTQEAGFSHCALRAKKECNWVSFMDVDEYFYFPYSSPRHERFRKSFYQGQNLLRALVSNFSSSDIAEIRTSCHSFGPSGLHSPPLQGVTIGYTCRLQSPERHKSIIRPDALDNTLLNVVHHFRLKKGFRYLNLPQSTATINHYKYQVWGVFRAKFYRRVATYVADWQENQNEGSRDRAPGLGTEAVEPPDWPQRFCEVWDTGLRDFVLANLADVSTGLLPWDNQTGLGG